MRPGKSLTAFQLILLTVVPLLLVASTWAAPSEKILYSFTGTGDADGRTPYAPVIFGPGGALYGTTQYGGAFGDGTVFKLVQNSDGTWTHSVIYSFAAGNDGAGPIGGLTFDPEGNAYGTTAFGGPSEQGTVFKLSPNSDGTWTESVLYSFTGGADGREPLTGVTFDRAGNLFGTTQTGGLGSGVAFALSPNSNGTWTETVIHNFGSNNSDGYYPSSVVVLDAAGNLFGVTSAGGGGTSAGTVYELSPNSNGTWNESILYRFTGKADGAGPSSVILGKAGNLYGTAVQGGIENGIKHGCNHNCGTVFRLAPSISGTWSFTRIYAFDGTTGDGPNALVFDNAGNLFGTTNQGGATFWGVAYELKLGVGGQRSYIMLYNFGQGTDGIGPNGITLKSGNLYGTTSTSTSCYGCGTVFQITP